MLHKNRTPHRQGGRPVRGFFSFAVTKPGAVIVLLACHLPVSAAEQPPGLNLNETLARVLEKSPALSQYPYRVRAAEAMALQAGLIPNPELSLELENVAGSGELSGADAMEATLALSQVIEMGGKREQRRQVGEWRSNAARDEYELARLDALADAALQFLAVAGSQWSLGFAERNRQWTTKAVEMAVNRHRAGSISEAELSRAKGDAMRAQLAVKQQQLQLANARTRLAALWGAEEAGFERVEAAIFRLPALPPYQQIVAQLEQSPRLERFATLQRLRAAEVDLAVARGRQDIRLGLGVRHDGASGENGLNLMLSMPLGVSDRNQGASRAARQQLAQLDSEREAARIDIATRIKTAWRRLRMLREQVETLRADILPEAENARALYSEGYRRGRFSYLALIEARQQRLAVEREAVNAALDYHRLLVLLETVSGEPLTTTDGRSPFFRQDERQR